MAGGPRKIAPQNAHFQVHLLSFGEVCTVKFTERHTLFACYFGYITQAIVNNLAPLLFTIFQDSFQISLEMIGRLILINFGTQLAADLFAVRYADRIGYRTAAVLAHVFCAAGLIGMGVLPQVLPSPYLGLVIAVMLYAVGGGLIEVLVSPIVESLPGDAKASAMSLLHSFYCWGQMGVVLLTTLLMKVLGAQFWPVLPILWALVPIANGIFFTRVPLTPLVAEEEKMSLRGLLASRGFVIALALMLAAGSSELTMSQWSSLFAEKGLQVSRTMGNLLGPCLFAVFMGLGRMVYGLRGQKIPIKAALMVSAGLCLACYAVTVFAHAPLFALLGCALTGLSVSLMWPGTFSLSAATFPRGGTAMFGMLAVFGDLGAAVGPWLAGFVSDRGQRSSALVALGAAQSLNPEQVGLKAGLFVAMIFPLIMLLGVALLSSQRKEPKRDV
jgi:fucose permease